MYRGDKMRYLIKFSYDGSNYCGFQSQKGLRTIQEELENALTKVNNICKTTLTATGSPAICVAKVSTFTESAVVVPPKP